MKRTIITISAVLCLTGCSINSESSDTERTKLSNAKSRWDSAMTPNVSGYVFTSRSSCHCVFTAPVRIGVANDSINSVIGIPAQNVLGDTDYIYLKTIDQWFSWIAKSLDEKPFVLTVEYDDTLGYPRKIGYDGSSQIADDELTHTNDSLSLIYRVAR